MKTEALVIDADGHILEPPNLWADYLEEKYRPRAIRIGVGSDGYEYFEVDESARRWFEMASSEPSAGWVSRSRKRGGGASNLSARARRISCAMKSRGPRTLISKAPPSARWI